MGSNFLPITPRPLVSLTRFMTSLILLIITVIFLGRPIAALPTPLLPPKFILNIFLGALRSPEQLRNILCYVININIWTIEIFLRLLRTCNRLPRQVYGTVIFWVN